MIPIKSEEDLAVLRESGKILARIIKRLAGFIRPGIQTAEINSLAEELFLEEKALPAFKGYRDFPAAVCTSINEEIVHGIPGERIIKEGDIVSLDLGIQYSGYFCDAAVTLGMGRITPGVKKLIEVTRQALSEGIKKARSGNHLYDISYSIQSYIEKHGFSVVREFVGHGIGYNLHEEPEIPNFGRPHEGPLLVKGMVLAIEPMVNMGSWEARILDNGWTAATLDGLPSAHFEHTIAITEDEAEILTKM